MSNCKKGTTTTYIGEVPVYAEAFPDYFIGVVNIEDPETGDTRRDFVQVPGERVVPNGSLANVDVLDTNNTGLEVPKGQVRAGYVAVGSSSNEMHYSDATHKPKFLMLGDYAGQMMIQVSGIVNIPEGHQYIIGQDYWGSTDGTGEPVTDDASGAHLFTPISQTKLAVNIYYK